MRPPEKPFMVTLPRSGGPCVICGDAVHLSYFFGTEEKGDGWTHAMNGRRKLHDHAAQPPLASVSHGEQFVIQSRRAGSDDDWADEMCLPWFAEPGRQQEALDIFRHDGDPGCHELEFRMVRLRACVVQQRTTRVRGRARIDPGASWQYLARVRTRVGKTEEEGSTMTNKMPGPLAFQAMMAMKVLAHRAEIQEDLDDVDRNGHELALGIDGLLTELCSDIADVIGLGPEQKKAFMYEAGCYDRA